MTAAVVTVFAILLVVTTATAMHTSSPRLRPTPMGLRPSHCIVQVPSGALVEEDTVQTIADELLNGPRLIITPVKVEERYVHTAHPECSIHHPKNRVVAAVAKTTTQSNTVSTNNDCNSPPCTCNNLPCNNWIDNAGAMNTTDYIGSMSATYVTPTTGPTNAPHGDQTLFYFIGAENTNGTARGGNPAPSGRAILQPVLTYDPSGWCSGSVTGWCYSSWYCCPKGLTVHSTYIQNIQPGDEIYGEFYLEKSNASEYITTGKVLRTKISSTLRCPRQGRNFNWADITQEVYKIQSCSDFAQSPMSFKNVQMFDINGKNMMHTADWLLTGPKPCNGTIVRHDDHKDGREGINTFVISHNN